MPQSMNSKVPSARSKGALSGSDGANSATEKSSRLAGMPHSGARAANALLNASVFAFLHVGGFFRAGTGESANLELVARTEICPTAR